MVVVSPCYSHWTSHSRPSHPSSVEGQFIQVTITHFTLFILSLMIEEFYFIFSFFQCGFFKRDRPPTAQAERLATNDPDARVADTKTRYAPIQQDYDDRRAML